MSVTGLPAGLRYSAGAVSGTVADDAVVKAYAVTITATDGVNDAVSAGFTVTVTPADVVIEPTPDPTPSYGAVNMPPVIVNPGDKTYQQGETINWLHSHSEHKNVPRCHPLTVADCHHR